jgi:hypothetical protein
MVHFDDSRSDDRWWSRFADLFVDDFGWWSARTLDYALNQLLGLWADYYLFFVLFSKLINFSLVIIQDLKLIRLECILVT